MAQSPFQYNPKTDQEHREELLCEAQEVPNLNDWENEFIEDLLSYKTKDKLWNLTENQYKKLVEITKNEEDDEYRW